MYLHYSEDFRKQVADYCAAGHSYADAHDKFGIPVNTVCRWVNWLKKENRLTGKKPVFNRRSRIDPNELRAFMLEHPNAPYREIAAHFGCSVSHAGHALQKYGIISRRRSRVKPEELKEYLQRNPAASYVDIARHLEIAQTSVYRILRRNGIRRRK